ncbi:hypothetical protein [Prosthecobacter vanneervenii]|uniref:Uncharacterized protein n=1 Tax=Prosthecobacter vanneervenii TaxID=48466 RepID=A0A7W8DK01_9BACT|nr:hypothetical protein [Prosthecobacter vanneervenii]MBB5032346.1 hypothetical protein [Prosthecobacter vanneervenii]
MRFLVLLFALSLVHAEDKPKFRTDADGPVKANEKRKAPKDRKPEDPPEWFPLTAGEFPPEGSAHAVMGELIHVEHLERRVQIRVDRNDSQERGIWDLPLDATLLPYGSVWYQGAPAALQDIPLGTHLHGWFYQAVIDDKTPLPDTWYKRKTPEWEFRRCIRIEDEFSFHARQQQLWKIDSVDLATKKITATLQDRGKPSGQPKLFDLLSSTRVFQKNSIADLKAIQPGQTVLFNLTWVTLYGPGRVTDIWLDEQARTLVTANQLERHRTYIRERGLPGWITEVDDEKQIVTVVFFDNVDPKLFDELKIKDPNAPPPKDGSPPPPEPRGGLAVALETLMTYDPVNDRKTGGIIEVKKIPMSPGCSGVQMKIRMDMMLEGYRPRRVVRFYPETWKVIALPKEEEYFGKE